MRRLRGRIAKALRLPRALRAMASWLEATDWVAFEAAQEARRAAERVLAQAAFEEAYEREMARVTLPAVESSLSSEEYRALCWAIAFQTVRTGEA